MFTISVIQNKYDKSYEKVEKFLNKEFPHNDTEGIFNYKYAPLSIKNYASMKDYTPSVGIFIFDVSDDEGVALDMIKAIKKSSVLKTIPVVLFSDSNDEVYRQSCINAGAERDFRREDLTKVAEYIKAVMTKKL
jgi:CheY-like chemotaxis protein